jgi:hypothetical protein
MFSIPTQGFKSNQWHWGALWGSQWEVEHFVLEGVQLTPKGRRPFFGLFLEFGQPIVYAIFVQKISNFWWTCGLVLASRHTNFYKIPIFGLAIMPQKHNYFELRATSGSQKTFYFSTFLGWIFFHKFLTKFLKLVFN